MNKAIKLEKLRNKDRQELDLIIPIATPFVLYIEPTNYCNLKCKFCPTGNGDLLQKIGRRQTHMSRQLLDKIINDIKEFNDKIKIIHLFKDGEPLMNPDFPYMYQMIKEADITHRIDFKTNGTLLNPQLNNRLINAGIESMGISVEGVTPEKYWLNSRVHIDYTKFIENIKDFYLKKQDCILYAKILDINLSEQEKDKFKHDFASICDYYYYENLMGWNNCEEYDFSLGAKMDRFDDNPCVKRKVCPLPFYSLSINAGGEVSVCCVDWSYQTIVGNVNTESLKSIWEGQKLMEFRLMHLEGYRNQNSACRDCTFIDSLRDNIDASRNKIISLLKLGK